MFASRMQEIINNLEQEELDGENVNAQLYVQLLAAYLYQNDLSNARYLWKRIPQNIKNGNSELERMRTVYLSLWNNNSSDFFTAVRFQWSKHIEGIMTELKDKIKNEILDLIGKVYTSIFENVFIHMTDIAQEEVTETCNILDWKIENEKFPRLIIPKKKVAGKTATATSEDQLFVLTEFVSFLEN